MNRTGWGYASCLSTVEMWTKPWRAHSETVFWSLTAMGGAYKKGNIVRFWSQDCRKLCESE
jgi:hypothetical protein